MSADLPAFFAWPVLKGKRKRLEKCLACNAEGFSCIICGR